MVYCVRGASPGGEPGSGGVGSPPAWLHSAYPLPGTALPGQGLGFLPRIKREAHVNKVVVEIETEQEGLVRLAEKDPTISRQQINPDNAALGCSFPPGWVKFP